MLRKQKKDTGNKTQKQFESFSRRLNDSKHSFWFEVLYEPKKFQLFLDWRKRIRSLRVENPNSSLSLKRFIFDMRKTRKYHVPVTLIRDSAINKILTK